MHGHHVSCCMHLAGTVAPRLQALLLHGRGLALKVMHMPLCRLASGSAPRSSQEALLEGASDGVQEAGTTLLLPPIWMLSSSPLASSLHSAMVLVSPCYDVQWTA